MVFKILSLDPGLTNLGWAISTYDSEKNHLTTHKFGRYQSVKNALKDTENTEKYGQRIISINLLRQEVRRLIDLYKPTHIASEDIFLHIRHINAFAALTMCLFAIRDAAFSRGLVVNTIPPRAVKKMITDTGEADKLAVQQAVLTNKNITVVDSKQNPISKMSEHEADAIAVGNAFVVHFVPLLLAPPSSVILPETEIKRKRRVVKKETITEVPIQTSNIKIPKKLSDLQKEKKRKK